MPPAAIYDFLRDLPPIDTPFIFITRWRKRSAAERARKAAGRCYSERVSAGARMSRAEAFVAMVRAQAQYAIRHEMSSVAYIEIIN